MKSALLAISLILIGFACMSLSFKLSTVKSSINRRRIWTKYQKDLVCSAIDTKNDDSIFDESSDYEDITGSNLSTAVKNAEENLLNKKLLAGGSALFASLLFLYQSVQPVSNVAILKVMERDSVPMNIAFCNGKPTVIDFYADWCINCKVSRYKLING
jgi:thiol-disulfide isomerase/thioredoxin